MRLSTGTLFCALLSFVSDTAWGHELAQGEHDAPKIPKCAHVSSEARYGAYGYDHLVEIENGCDHALQCTVKTDVNPEPSNVAVPAKETRTVVTFRGSPSREFKADVRCTAT
jgi:hypothetical protein